MKRVLLVTIFLTVFFGYTSERGRTEDWVWLAGTYTLYRNSVLDPLARIHVATFDADESASYNRENCEIARNLFSSQPGVTVLYWCEQYRYRR